MEALLLSEIKVDSLFNNDQHADFDSLNNNHLSGANIVKTQLKVRERNNYTNGFLLMVVNITLRYLMNGFTIFF